MADALAQLREADPVPGRVIDVHPGFDPRAWRPYRSLATSYLFQTALGPPG